MYHIDGKINQLNKEKISAIRMKHKLDFLRKASKK